MPKYVLDTNVLIENPNIVTELEGIIIPMTVIEELDKLKTKKEEVGRKARTAIKNIKENKHKIAFHTTELSGDVPDNKILSSVLNIKNGSSDSEEVIFLTNDYNLQIKAEGYGVETRESDIKTNVDYTEEFLDNLYCGYKTFEVDDDIIDSFYGNEVNILPVEIENQLYINEYFLLRSTNNYSKTCIGRFNGYGRAVKKLETSKEGYKVFGIKPRNIEQIFCLDALLDPAIPVVSLIGKAGCGKTLLAVAAGVQQVFGKYGSEKNYDRIIISRPIQPMGNDIGYLPGTLEEKMGPWIQPILDNLEVLTGRDQTKIDGWFEKGKISIEAPTYIRGRSISNSYIILDEAQNLTQHEIKTILTRIGEGTKIVLTGDIEQIDNPKIDKFTNGLTYAIEALKSYDLTSHITLRKSERSKVAELCAKVL